MLGFDLPRKDYVWKFTRPSTNLNAQWMTWEKPPGLSMVHILAVGAGGGGGGGFGAASGNRGGGGGGAGGGVSSLLVPAHLLPSVLYLCVGIGGLGVTTGTSAITPLTIVSVYPSNGATNILLRAEVGPGGSSGTATVVGAGGIQTIPSALTTMLFAGLGTLTTYGGPAGAPGGAVAGGPGAQGLPMNSPLTPALTTGGAGGAGVNATPQVGGAFSTTFSNPSLIREQAPVAPAAGSNPGSGGTQLWAPFFSIGGCGGSSNNAGVGGAGGNGAYGAGGGGGGAGTSAGRGGDGGQGIIIITGW